MKHDCSSSVRGVSPQLQRLKARDFELQGIGVLVTTALLLGLLAFIAASGGARTLLSSSLPQLVTGLVALLVLLNAYLVSQKRSLHRATDLVIEQVISESIVQKYSFIDPVTQLFTREYLDHAIARELIHAHQRGSALTFMFVKVCTTGTQTDAYVTDAAQLLRSTFRGSDTLIRVDHHDFLVILSETTEHGATIAARRLVDKVDHWNVSANHVVEITLQYRLRAYLTGAQQPPSIDDLVREFTIMHDGDTRITPPPAAILRPPIQVVH